MPYTIKEFEAWPFRMIIEKDGVEVLPGDRHVVSTSDTLASVKERPENVAQWDILVNLINAANYGLKCASDEAIDHLDNADDLRIDSTDWLESRRLTKQEILDLQPSDTLYYVCLWRTGESKPVLIWNGEITLHIERAKGRKSGQDHLTVITPDPNTINWAEGNYSDVTDDGVVVEDYWMQIFKAAA